MCIIAYSPTQCVFPCETAGFYTYRALRPRCFCSGSLETNYCCLPKICFSNLTEDEILILLQTSVTDQSKTKTQHDEQRRSGCGQEHGSGPQPVLLGVKTDERWGRRFTDQ